MNEQHFEESNNKEKLAKKEENKPKENHSTVVMMMGAIQKSHNQAVNVVLNAITLQSESMGIDSFFWKQAQVATRGSAGLGVFFASFFINEEIK